MRAPDSIGGCNKRAFDPGEHIGHIKREWAAKLAPILDYLICTGMLDSVCFDCFLSYGDTNHTKKSCDITVLSDKLANLVTISEL